MEQLINTLKSALDAGLFSGIEKTEVSEAITDLENGNFKASNYFTNTLELLNCSITNEILDFLHAEKTSTQIQGLIADIQCEPQWSIIILPSFSRSVENIDIKLKGRIVIALIMIYRNPAEVKGDTMRPLAGNSKGLWRYRIGDYRLVYFPDLPRKRIALVTFGSREDVYRDLPNTH